MSSSLSRALCGALLAVALLSLAGCKKVVQCQVPIGLSACQLQPDSPLYAGLNHVGGYEYLMGGYHGMVVVRAGYADFVVYERCCPFDKGIVEVDKTFGSDILTCPTCGSRFSTFADGMPMDGSRTPCSLYQYGCTFDGSTLFIY